MSRGLGPSAPPGAPREAGTSKSCLPGLATRGAGGVHLSPWPVEAGRATQLCPEQRNRGGREVRTRRTRPLPAPRKALAAGGAWCGGAWCGVAGRHGPADEEGREAQQGARARAPHANMVSCNHLNKSKVTTPSRSVSRVLKNRNMVSSRTRQHTKLSKSTARSGSE